MRLVDVDELKLELKWLEVDTPVYHDVMSTIDEMPTVEPKHGHWKYDNQYHWYRACCSECGYYRVTDIKADRWNEWKYCPNCGAKMDAIDAIISNVSTVDAEEVVRCKDCYYCATEKSFGKEYLYCDAFAEHAEGDLIGVSLMVEPNHFCSWGERREDADT